jgi:DNA-binding response OmpR family regulator
MSGYAEGAVSDRDALPDGQDFLGKPFSPSELTARVRALLDRV